MGVKASILDIIEKSKKPLTMPQILTELVKRFPERKESSMKGTMNVQIGGKANPTRIEKMLKVKLYINDIDGVKYFSM